MKRAIKKPPQQVQYKNDVRLKLLVILPSFHEDVQKFRKEFGIPQDGFKTHKEHLEWRSELIREADHIKDTPVFLRMAKEILLIKNPPEQLKKKIELYNTIPFYKFGSRKTALGEKYKLPAHFYINDSSCGLSPYLTRNVVRAPSDNWAISNDGQGGKGTAKQLSIITYGILSESEAKEALKMLLDLQHYYLPKEVTVNTRTKKNFERDLLIFQEFAKRMKKPVIKKHYKKDSYLSLAERTKADLSPKKWKELERNHKDTIDISFDEKTSQEVGDKFGISGDAARKAAGRTRDTISDFFGDEFLPDVKSSR